jgi:hypothetical protein
MVKKTSIAMKPNEPGKVTAAKMLNKAIPQNEFVTQVHELAGRRHGCEE